MCFIIGDIAKRSGGDFGHISANESRSFELDKSAIFL